MPSIVLLVGAECWVARVPMAGSMVELMARA